MAHVIPDELVTESAAWNTGLDVFGLEGVPEPVGVVAAVAEQALYSGRRLSQERYPKPACRNSTNPGYF